MSDKPVIELDAEPEFDPIFDIMAGSSAITRITGYAPEIRYGEIVVPIEISEADGTKRTVGFIVDREHLRTLMDALDFPEEFGAE